MDRENASIVAVRYWGSL